VEFDHGAPFYFLVASTLLMIPLLLASIGLLPGARIQECRSVLVHADCERVWEVVGSVPLLYAGHGKVRDFGRVTDWSLRHGDGESAGSIWRALGTWGASPYWVDVEIVRIVPGKEIAVRLRRDSLGTHRGLRDHVGALSLESIGPDTTKLTWRLGARLRGPKILVARLLSSQRLRARLLDQGLRSLKVEIDNATREEEPHAPPTGEAGDLLAPPPRSGRTPPETTV
jgi:hypothetical protein